MNEAIIVDIDGTLALFNDKDPYDRDFTQDEVNAPVKELVKKYYYDATTIIVVSGRKDIYKEQTQQWLFVYASYAA